jgi:5-oxoprolinase (ATP-hydrolysing) subunit A
VSTPGQTTVDLATELGEAFALPPCGIPLSALHAQKFDGRALHPRHLMPRDDSALLDLISTGYVACGAHSGDPIVMGETIRLLAERNIAIGAHPSYPDMLGFGQAPMELADKALEDVILVQLAAVAALAERAGSRLSTVKCHGALSFDVSYDERTTQVMARAIARFDESVSLVCMAASPGIRVARDCGIKVVREAYIDRGYDRAGRIVPRQHPRALLTDPASAVAQFSSIALQQRVRTVDGAEIPLSADSFCLHSDTPNSGAIGAAVGKAIIAHDIVVSPTS